MRGPGVLCVAILLGGCATASSPTDGVAPPSSVIAPREGEHYSGHVYVTPDTRATVAEYTATVDAVWNATVDAYLALGIETVISESEGLIGNPHLEVTRRLAGERLSRYVRCGTDDTGMPAADSYRVRLDIRSRVTPLSDASARLETTVVATARDMSGTSTDPVQCVSTGGLEARLAAEVGARLSEGG